MICYKINKLVFLYWKSSQILICQHFPSLLHWSQNQILSLSLYIYIYIYMYIYNVRMLENDPTKRGMTVFLLTFFNSSRNLIKCVKCVVLFHEYVAQEVHFMALLFNSWSGKELFSTLSSIHTHTHIYI